MADPENRPHIPFDPIDVQAMVAWWNDKPTVEARLAAKTDAVVAAGTHPVNRALRLALDYFADDDPDTPQGARRKPTRAEVRTALETALEPDQPTP